eukprot:6213628-Pleurochrysis_carterae.AAC.6
MLLQSGQRVGTLQSNISLNLRPRARRFCSKAVPSTTTHRYHCKYGASESSISFRLLRDGRLRCHDYKSSSLSKIHSAMRRRQPGPAK